jgi:hypothetical protein
VVSSLSESELRKLVAIMECGTGSDFDNERLVALNMARQLLAGHELRWRDVLHAEPEAPAPARYWKGVAKEILQDRQGRITDWEQGFLLSLALKAHRLTDKRAAVLDELCDPYGVARWVTL